MSSVEEYTLDDDDEIQFLDESGSEGKEILENFAKRADDLTNTFNKNKIKGEKETKNENRSNTGTGLVLKLPSKYKTGISPEMTRVCATISGKIYKAEKKSDLNISDGKIKDLKVVLLDRNICVDGKDKVKANLDASTPTFAIVVTGKTMILGWRGSKNPMDYIVDAAFVPLASRSWIKKAPCVRAQGAMLAIVENHMCIHEDFILGEIQRNRIDEIVLTGHSLGGGIAQVAHMYIKGEVMTKGSNWNVKATESIMIRTVAFSAPMTTCLLDRTHEASRLFINEVGSTMCNIVYKQDIIPRGYGHLDYAMDVLNDAVVPVIYQKVNNTLPYVLQGGVNRYIVNAYIRDPIKDAENLMAEKKREGKTVDDAHSYCEEKRKSGKDTKYEMLAVAAYYRHIGYIIHYKDAEADPLVYIDSGSFYRIKKGEVKSDGQKPTDVKGHRGQFRKIKYENMKKSAFEELSEQHNFLVGKADAGLGLAYQSSYEKVDE